MWIVRLALNRPHTFVVLSITIILFGLISLKRMAIDIFPVINMPIVSCIWTYQGMSPFDIENLVTSVTERALTSTINGIQKMESMSLNGMSIIKVYLQQGTPVGESVAMVASVGSAILRTLPRSISAPFVTSSSATDVPVLQLSLTSNKLSEADLFDIANNLIRTQLAMVKGTKTPFPYGGKFKQVVIDMDPKALLATGLSPADIVSAIQDQNVMAPTGTMKMGSCEYIIELNNLPKSVSELNNLPVQSQQNKTVFIKDVACVHEGYQPQTNIVNLNQKRAVLFNVLKGGEASTLTVVRGVKDILPRIRSLIPASCNLDILIDQSKFVQECVAEVAREAVIAAGLTAVMMLALLGSWRSTLIVSISIPLAMLCAIIGLNLLGQTINSMTLGGLALAVGMLVDDATVVIENVHSNMTQGKNVVTSILDGAEQVALPALVSTLSICIVFVPVVLLTEPSKSLFLPMGLAVILAMMASYGLSRTVVPLMMKYLLKGDVSEPPPDPRNSRQDLAEQPHQNIFITAHHGIESMFENARKQYCSILQWMLTHKRQSFVIFSSLYATSFFLFIFIGQEYFPYIDSGQIRLHVSAPAGTRVEETDKLFAKIEQDIRRYIPAKELALISNNIGMPVNGLNYAYSDSQTISAADGEILISLCDKRTKSTLQYQKIIRKILSDRFPQCTSYFQPADIISQILSAGLPAPIDVKVLGMNKKANYIVAQQIKRQIEAIPGVVDIALHQVTDSPSIHFEVDRIKAGQMGLTQNDVSNSFYPSFSSSFQINPNFWLNPDTGVNYILSAQVPQSRLSNLNAILTIPVVPTEEPQVAAAGTLQPAMLANLASFKRVMTPSVVSHIDVQPTFDIFASCQGRDLGSVSRDIKKVLDGQRKIASDKLKSEQSHPGQVKTLPLIILAGQVLSMNAAFIALGGGLVFSLILVYFLLVVNFQSWSDPLIILMSVPGAFSGIAWALFVTQTNLSIPALMGAIMTIGVASANSILMISFARDELKTGCNSVQAALNAGFQRFRPVIMTATAMIVGMIPMALGLGSGSSQNAPIGRVVIGGLTFATVSTLFFVPLMFSIFRANTSPRSASRGEVHVDS